MACPEDLTATDSVHQISLGIERAARKGRNFERKELSKLLQFPQFPPFPELGSGKVLDDNR
jgi:hypothetical protein